MQIEKYKQFNDIILLIKQARVKAIGSVNREMIELYWNVGCYISTRIDESVWGESVVEELAEYLKKTEPTLNGKAAVVCPPRASFIDPLRQNMIDPLRQNKNDP